MSEQTTNTRAHAVEALGRAGFRVREFSRGQRVFFELMRGHEKPIEALVKTASLGQAMVKTSNGDPDGARISGFGEDVDRVLFAVGNGQGDVAAYLVPRDEAETAFREAQRGWLVDHKQATNSTTWVIYFSDRGSSAANGYDKKWAKYRVTAHGGEGASRIADEPKPIPPNASDLGLTIGEAKRLLSLSLGVPIDAVRITIEA